MNSETRFLALVTALLMLWVVSSAARESADAPSLKVAATITGPSQPSDQRLKEDIRDLPYGLSELLGLRPVSYRYRDYPSHAKIGLIAQEVKSIVPEVVYLSPENAELPAPRYYAINYAELVPLLVRSIQQQQAAIVSLENRIGTLESSTIQ